MTDEIPKDVQNRLEADIAEFQRVAQEAEIVFVDEESDEEQ